MQKRPLFAFLATQGIWWLELICVHPSHVEYNERTSYQEMSFYRQHLMKLKMAYIQAENGIPATDTFFRAWDGFRKR